MCPRPFGPKAPQLGLSPGFVEMARVSPFFKPGQWRKDSQMSVVATSKRTSVGAERPRRRPFKSHPGQRSLSRRAPEAAPRASQEAEKDRHGDLQLVRQAQAGNGHAFELLVWKHQAQVLNVAK